MKDSRKTKAQLIEELERLRQQAWENEYPSIEDLLVSILDETSDMVSTSDTDGNLIFLNQAARRVFGIPEAANLHIPKAANRHPSWAYDIIQKVGIPTAIKNGVWKGQTAVVTHQGKEIPVSQVILSHRTPDGTVKYLSSIARDISDLAEKQKHLQESKRGLEIRVREQIAELRRGNEALEQEILDHIETEARLQESNEILESVFSNIHMLIALMDTDFNFIRVNEAYARAAERPVAFFRGKNHFDLYPHKENEHIFRNVIASGKPHAEREKPFVYPGHPLRTTYWDWMLHPLKTEKDTVYGLLLSLIDVTAQVEARKKVEIYAEELETKNSALSDFASLASHDLREPLRKILTFGSRLESNLTDTLRPDDRDYLKRMQSAAQRMQTMLDGLLQYSLVAARSQRFTMVDLTRAAEAAVSNLHVRMEETGATVSVEPLPAVRADGLQMLQLIQNLIGNGLKFHRKGVPPHIRVSGKIVDDTNRYCELRVEDNGIGFDPKHVDQIFLPFKRLQGRQGPEGAGMGLAICRKIVERHGGTITADSEPGGGSCFIVSLPDDPLTSVHP